MQGIAQFQTPFKLGNYHQRELSGKLRIKFGKTKIYLWTQESTTTSTSVLQIPSQIIITV
jgi:hypothetical protein